MKTTKTEALNLLLNALSAATDSGLFDSLVDDCQRPDSINDICDAATLYDEFHCFCVDHQVNFDNAIPLEFEYHGTVYQADWCWRTAGVLGLTERLRIEKY